MQNHPNCTIHLSYPLDAYVDHCYQKGRNAAETNSTVFTLLLDTHTFYRHSLSCMYLLMSVEGQKGKGTEGCPFFPFPSMSSFLA